MADVEPEEYGTNWPAEFIQEVLGEYPDDEKIGRNVSSGVLMELLWERSVAARNGLLDEVRQTVVGLESPESKVYRYTAQLKEALARIDRREELYRRAMELAKQTKLATAS
jgi:hypothetical protein